MVARGVKSKENRKVAACAKSAESGKVPRALSRGTPPLPRALRSRARCHSRKDRAIVEH